MNKQDDKLKEVISENDYIIKTIIKKYITKASQIGIDFNDLYQEGLLALYKASESFDENNKASFKTYASVIIERRIKDLLKINDRYGSALLNEAVSLDEVKEDEGSLYEVVASNKYSPLDESLAIELDNEIKNSLTINETKVYELKKEGKSNKEISNILNIDVKSVENTYQRIKSKVKKLL